ncbi:hypothetical protein ACFLT0_01415 [Chloroflexota bacterium]
MGNLTRCKMLVIGTGGVGRLVAKAARKRGTSRIVIASRTRERTLTLTTAVNGTLIGLDGLVDE